MTSDIEVADRMIDAFLRGDGEAVATLCADDIEFVNVPLPKTTITGRAAMVERAANANAGFPEPVSDTGHRVERAITNGEGDVVIERFDYWTLRGTEMSMPAVGIFRVENGRVKSWTDHYDIGIYIRQVEAVGIELDTSLWW
jgi:limonene-1,2-epoxide hydrolase